MLNDVKFIEVYENKIRKLRKHYLNDGNPMYTSTITIAFLIKLVPMIISIFILLLFNFNPISLIVSFVLLIVLSIVIGIINKTFKLEENEYLYELRKLLIFNTKNYEERLNKLIFNKGGYYEKELSEIINSYHIEEKNSYFIDDLRGNSYLLYDNQDKDEIYIVDKTLKNPPKVMKIAKSNIRYYRLDSINSRLILKTDLDELYYAKESKVVFDKIIKNKSNAEKKEYNPKEFIDDYERFMSKIKRKDVSKKEIYTKSKSDYLNKIKTLCLLEVIFIVLSFIYKDSSLPINIIYLVILLGIAYLLNAFISLKNIYLKTDKEYIEYINKDKDCQDKFLELKLALHIPKEVHKVYSDEGAEFLCWDNAGYFHLFLNLIYFESIYLVIKIKDVDYYRIKDNYCILKINDKSFIFNKDAKYVFDKLLPNKDYDWLKGIINR